MALNEDRILERVLDDFISKKVEHIEVHRAVKELNSRRGLVKTDELTLDPQLVRIMPFKRRLTDEYRDLPADRITKVEYIVIGNVDLDLQERDWFVRDGEQYEVEFVSAQKFHRIHAGVSRRHRDAPE